ncbi:MAG: hypothetical protein Q8J78_03720 [Moraxellaceae bacterium]|nr:hypothetical protein [Moraxellaceae bacterium]
MIDNASPLEYLAAFAITFTAGMVTAAALRTYSQWLKKQVSATTATAK